jgi:hypothetical protein
MLAETPIVSEFESAKEWAIHHGGMRESLEPVGYLEEALVQRLAAILWRLQRVGRFERELIAVQHREVAERLAAQEAEPARGRSLSAAPASGHVDAAQVPRLRSALGLLERLPELADDVPLTGEEVSAVLFDVAKRFDVNLASLPVAGLPHSRAWGASTDWTAGRLRAVLAAIARREQQPVETLLEEERFGLAWWIGQAAPEVASRELREQRMRAESLLPADGALHKLVRYESQLNRQFFQALHELEALQSRRAGDQAPLARLDINGLPEASS